MKKVIIEEEVQTITIDKLIDELHQNNDLIVYYRSSNSEDGVPCFFKKARTGGLKFSFISAVSSYGLAFESTSIRETITEAARIRQLFVIRKDEQDKLFKKQI